MSPFILDLIEEMGYEKVRSVASGNRALMLLEGKGAAYIRDTGGFSKWDTSGPQVRCGPLPTHTHDAQAVHRGRRFQGRPLASARGLSQVGVLQPAELYTLTLTRNGHPTRTTGALAGVLW